MMVDASRTEIETLDEHIRHSENFQNGRGHKAR
jgi:hypothetical protein